MYDDPQINKTQLVDLAGATVVEPFRKLNCGHIYIV